MVIFIKYKQRIYNFLSFHVGAIQIGNLFLFEFCVLVNFIKCKYARKKEDEI